MTAILKRGDRIILAFPVNATPDKDETEKQVAETAEFLSASFAEQGVTVIQFSAHTTSLTHPVVVAVFRDEEGN